MIYIGAEKRVKNAFKYLPHFRSAIQVPVFVYGIEEGKVTQP